MHRGKKRKLLRLDIAKEAEKLHGKGVPLTRIIKDLNLNLSQPTLRNLLACYEAGNGSDEVKARLFPTWLDDNEAIQEPPDGWYYDGCFPLTGAWRQVG